MTFDLTKIYGNLGNTEKKDWSQIMKSLEGSSRLETMENVENFILENFSFEIAQGAEGYAYFGNIDANSAGWQLVKAQVEQTGNQYGYISSTQAGMLFNDNGFNEALKGILKNVDKYDNILFDLYEGENYFGIKNGYFLQK